MSLFVILLCSTSLTPLIEDDPVVHGVDGVGDLLLAVEHVVGVVLVPQIVEVVQVEVRDTILASRHSPVWGCGPHFQRIVDDRVLGHGHDDLDGHDPELNLLVLVVRSSIPGRYVHDFGLYMP